jgi:hypothetical protein
MAKKSTNKLSSIGKISFGKKSKRGKAKKKFGPREQKPKSYKGQGRYV